MRRPLEWFKDRGGDLYCWSPEWHVVLHQRCVPHVARVRRLPPAAFARHYGTGAGLIALWIGCPFWWVQHCGNARIVLNPAARVDLTSEFRRVASEVGE